MELAIAGPGGANPPIAADQLVDYAAMGLIYPTSAQVFPHELKGLGMAEIREGKPGIADIIGNRCND